MYLLQAEARQLKIIIDQINPDFRCDSLTFYDGDSQKAALIGPYCGESILPSPFVSTSNKALIHFQSDLDTTFASYRDFYGFKLQYHPYSKLGFDNRLSAVQKHTKTHKDVFIDTVQCIYIQRHKKIFLNRIMF